MLYFGLGKLLLSSSIIGCLEFTVIIIYTANVQNLIWGPIVGHNNYSCHNICFVILVKLQRNSFQSTILCMLLRITMQGMQPGHQWIAQAAVQVLLLSALQVSSAMQCSTGNVIVVDGKLVFPEVSQKDFNFSMIPESSNGMLDGWYVIAESFVDAVRPGGLPYREFLPILSIFQHVNYLSNSPAIIQGEIEDQHLACDVINPQPPGCTEETQSGSFDVIAVLQLVSEIISEMMHSGIVG